MRTPDSVDQAPPEETNENKNDSTQLHPAHSLTDSNPFEPQNPITQSHRKLTTYDPPFRPKEYIEIENKNKEELMNNHSRMQIKLANSPRNLSPNLQTTQQYQSHTIYAPHLTLPAWMR